MPPESLVLEPHLRDQEELADAAAEAEGFEEDEPPPPAVGTQDLLVILAQFSDQSLTTAPADWSDLFFGPTDSLADYYDVASFGALDIAPAAESQGTVDDGVVTVTLPTPHPDPGRNFGAFQPTARSILEAADASVDFDAYDTDNDGFLAPDELHLGIVVAGTEAALGCAGPSVWAHRTSLDDSLSADGVFVGDFSSRGGFFTGGEIQCNGEDDFQATVGVWVHEFGHDLGLIDLYDLDGSTAGVDTWSVMGLHWLALPGEEIGTRPPLPDPFSRWQLGWLTPTQVTSAGDDVALAASATSDDVVRVLDNPDGVDVGFLGGSGTGEYFLVENRQQVGYDVALPGCGLLVWHIDERQFDNAVDDSRRVDVEEAGGGRFNDGFADSEDPYPSEFPFNDRFTPDSSPNSDLNTGLPSGVALTDFSPTCGPTLTLDVDPDAVVPRPVNDRFGSAKVIRISTFAATAHRTVRGHNVGTTHQPGESPHHGADGRSSVWWVLRAPHAGYLNLTTQSTFREVVAVYTGPSLTRLTPVESVRGTPPDSGAGRPQPENVFRGLGFRVERNVRYLIAVDSAAEGVEGGIRLGVDFDAARPDVRPVQRVVAPGGRVELSMQVRNTSVGDRLRVYGWAEDFRSVVPLDCPTTFVLRPGEARTCRFRSFVTGGAGEQLRGKLTAWIEWPDQQYFSFTADSWFARVRGLRVSRRAGGGRRPAGRRPRGRRTTPAHP